MLYKKMYYSLFNSITDALNAENFEKAKEILQQGQIKTEEMYIEYGENYSVDGCETDGNVIYFPPVMK